MAWINDLNADGATPWGEQERAIFAEIRTRIDSLGGGGSGVVTPESQGAIGDGTTDDTAAIQATLDAAHTLGGTVLFSPKTYRITVALRTYENVNIVGAGNAASIIHQATASANGVVLEAAADTAVRSYIKDIRITGNGGTGKGVVVGATTGGAPMYGLALYRVYVAGFGSHGFHLHGNFMVNVEGCETWDNGGHGFWFDGGTVTGPTTGTGTWQTSTNVDNCYANHNGGAGFRFDKATYFAVSACGADNNAIGYDMMDCTTIAFSACGAESPDDPARQISVGSQAVGFKVSGTAYSGSSNITFLACYAYSVTQTAFLFNSNAINCTMISSRQLTAATISAITDHGVRINSGCYVTMVGNTVPDGVLVNAGGKVMQLAAATAVGDPAGIYFNDTSPSIYPYTDSVSITARAASQVPLVVKGYTGQTTSLLKVADGGGANQVSVTAFADGQLAFGTDEATVLERPTGVNYLSTNQPLRVPHYTSIAGLPAASSYTNCICSVDAGSAIDKPMIVFSNGTTWLSANVGYWQPASTAT